MRSILRFGLGCALAIGIATPRAYAPPQCAQTIHLSGRLTSFTYEKSVVIDDPVDPTQKTYIDGPVTIESHGLNGITVNGVIYCLRADKTSLDGAPGTDGYSDFGRSPQTQLPVDGGVGVAASNLTLKTSAGAGGCAAGSIVISRDIYLRGGNGGSGGKGADAINNQACAYYEAQNGANGAPAGKGGNFVADSAKNIYVLALIDTSGGVGGAGGNGGEMSRAGTPSSKSGDGGGALDGLATNGGPAGSIILSTLPVGVVYIGTSNVGSLKAEGGNGSLGGDTPASPTENSYPLGGISGSGGKGGAGGAGGEINVTAGDIQAGGYVCGISTKGGNAGEGGEGSYSLWALPPQNGTCYDPVTDAGGNAGAPGSAGNGQNVSIGVIGSSGLNAITCSFNTSGGHGAAAGNPGHGGGLQIGGNCTPKLPGGGLPGSDGGASGNVTVRTAITQTLHFHGVVMANGGDGGRGSNGAAPSKCATNGFDGVNGGTGGVPGNLIVRAGFLDFSNALLQFDGGNGGDGGNAGCPGGNPGVCGDAASDGVFVIEPPSVLLTAPTFNDLPQANGDSGLCCP